MLVIIEIPYHGLGVLTTRAQREPSGDIETVFRDPHRGHDGVLVVGKEPDALDPVGVSILLDGVLALA